MKKAILLLLGIFIISFCYADCSENQIDINSANKEELVKIYQIGDSRAEQIISSRPFESIDQLTNIMGIGEKYLKLIKSENLACVSNKKIKEGTALKNNTSEENNELINKELNELKKEIDLLKKELELYNSKNNNKKELNTTPKIIKLSPKDIKSTKNKKILDKSDYALYGFIAFSVTILLLTYIRKNKIKKEIV